MADVTIELVVSSDLGAFHALATPLPGSSEPLKHTIYHHDESQSETAGYAGKKHVREAGTFLTHVTTRYDVLASRTAFVHEDAWLHNPVWPHWLACLRDNATHATLSPLWQPTAPGQAGALGAVLGANVSATENVPWSCCFLIVEQRATLRAKARGTYALARAMLDEGSSNGSSVTAFHLENAGHVLRPLRSDWLKPCTNYRCEEPRCKQMVGFVKLEGPFTHGIPLTFESNSLRAWQERACGVRDVSKPEAWQLASVREEIALPCNESMLGVTRGTGSSMMRTRAEVQNRTGCNAMRSRAMRSWMREVTTKYASSFQRTLSYDTPSAKAAVFALKGGACTGLVRCWHACCAECSRHAGWCVAWQWTLAGRCALSAEAPVMASESSFERVVGRA